jgi:hypothetical protein
MKRIVLIALGLLAVVSAVMMYNVWRGSQEAVTRTPSPLETGRAQLHMQLEEARKTESQAEQQDWNSAPQLRALIQGHEQRAEKLKDNREAAEIVAYDRDAIDRLQKRIGELAAEEQARQAAAKNAAAEPSQK